MNSKKPAATKIERKKQLAKFKEERELQAQLHNIIKMQSLFRGAIVRKHKIPHIKNTANATKAVANSMIERYIEDVFIPDLLLELLTFSRVTGNFSLYSPQTQALMEIRQKMISHVVRNEVEAISRHIITTYID